MRRLHIKKYLFFLIILFLFIISSAFAQDYIVGEGDVIKITVYDHPDLTTTARVSGDEMISMPLIGHINVGGLTITQISKKIAELLDSEYIVDPHVTIFIQEFRSKNATIMGHVIKPGLYELHGHTTFLEILSKAGGLRIDAGDYASIKRKAKFSENREKIITIDLKRLIEMGDTSLDLPIMDGDSIYITKGGLFYVTGEVRRPDAYKHKEGITVIKAITMAGGFTGIASTKEVKIIRNIDGKEKVIKKVRMDDHVLQEDVIVVPESFF